jgi:hypothetical protein
MAAAPGTRLLTTHTAQWEHKLGIESGLLTERTILNVVCETRARFTGVSDSLKLVSGRSTGGKADRPKTPAMRNRIKIRQRRIMDTPTQVSQRYSRKNPMSNGILISTNCCYLSSTLIMERTAPDLCLAAGRWRNIPISLIENFGLLVQASGYINYR